MIYDVKHLPFFECHSQLDCTPDEPCVHCQAVTWLKGELGEEKYIQFLRIFGTIPPEMDIDLEDIPAFQSLSVRTERALRDHQIKTLRQLLSMRKFELQRLPHFGDKSFREVTEALKSIGHHIRE